MRERKGVELHGRGDRKELGKLEGRELELVYIVWEKNAFNKGDIFEKKREKYKDFYRFLCPQKELLNRNNKKNQL